jgi:hypothetical protein
MGTELVKQNADLGGAILEEARKRYNEQRQEKVVSTVGRLMLLRDEATDRIAFFTSAVDWYDRKMAALKAGEFKLTTQGELDFNQEELKRANY